MGNLAPGNSPGTLSINGDFTQDASGILVIEMGGLGQGEFDILDVSGNAILDGMLEIELFGGYMPTLGDTFNVLYAVDIFGSFTNGPTINAGLAEFDWSFIENVSGDDFLQLTTTAINNPVPIPSAILLMGSGLFFLCGIKRKQADKIRHFDGYH